MKKNILITGPYLPGKSYGGPVKSLFNMVESLSDYYNFYIITNDRDLNAKTPYEDVVIGEWNKIGKGNVMYLPSGEYYKKIKSVLSEINFDLVYCSSFFGGFSIIVQYLSIIGRINIPIIVAPRGEFSNSALKIKKVKKKIFLFVYKLFNLQQRVTFTCSSEEDMKDIQKILGDIEIYKAGNIATLDDESKKYKRRTKAVGELKIATVSRVARIKNIDYSLKILKDLGESDVLYNDVVFDIFGPIEDKEYYEECQKKAADLKGKIQVNFRGAIDYKNVVSTLTDYHVFLFPTQGENFGHVIQEALIAGCPVIISNNTPWKRLKEHGVGNEISLQDRDIFKTELIDLIKMDSESFFDYSLKAYEYGVYKVKSQKALKEHENLFNRGIL